MTLTRELVRVPSRGGIDPYDRCWSAWRPGWAGTAGELPSAGRARRRDSGAGVRGARRQARPPTCRMPAWTRPRSATRRHGPTPRRPGRSPRVAAWPRIIRFQGGGRDLRPRRRPAAGHGGRLRGSVVLLFDVDEHTGGFGGAKAYFEGAGAARRVDGVMIGYPGLDHVVTGGRGCCAPAFTCTASPAFWVEPDRCRRSSRPPH